MAIQIEMKGFERMLNHIMVQNAHNAARLNALLNATAYLLANQHGTEHSEEIEMLIAAVNKDIPNHLGSMLDAVNDVPDIK